MERTYNLELKTLISTLQEESMRIRRQYVWKTENNDEITKEDVEREIAHVKRKIEQLH